jgi:hypothetical protein
LHHVSIVAVFQLGEELAISTLEYTSKPIITPDDDKGRLLKSCYLQWVVV